MKKLLALLLSGMMVFSFTACGGEEAEDTSADSDAQVEVEADTTVDEEVEVESEVTVETEATEIEIVNMYLSFGNMDEVQVYEIGDVSNTVWSFAGGMADGVQFREEDYYNAMAAFGGTMYVVFNEDNTAQMVQGGGTLQGKYMVTEDTLALSFDNNGSEVLYACAMTIVEDIPVLMAYTDESFTNAIYLICQ